MSLRNILLRAYFSRRMKAIDRFRRNPHEVQHEMLVERLKDGAATEFGRHYGLTPGMTPSEFAASIDIQDYETFKPYIIRMMSGVCDVTAKGRVTMFARSSGTTSDRSKYIPVTKDSIWWNHALGMRDVASIYSDIRPHTKVFEGRTLTLGGSCAEEKGVVTGDLSAVLISNTPFWSGWFRAPGMETALIPDFDEKAAAICRECAGQNITAFAGVPSWNLELMRRVLEYTGKDNLLEVWPRLEMFAHGGVGFAPYRRSFETLIPSSDMYYMETYNASEGFFAIADDPSGDDMLLMLDYGTYFEFRSGSEVVPLEGVKCGVVYAVIITSNNGLWRYEIGDTVEFTSTSPYRVRFAGRTKQYINVFGEELIVDNAEKALLKACGDTGALVEEYSVAPRYMSINQRGSHEWVVEFTEQPDSVGRFAEVLDAELRELNSDYDAKRRTTLDLPVITIVERGTMHKWLLANHKNKVPRMMNDRSVVDQIVRGLES